MTKSTMMLRPMVEDDLPFMLEVRNQMREFRHFKKVFTLEKCLAWYRATRPEQYIVCVSADPVGVMRVKRETPHPNAAEIAGDIHYEHKEHDYARRAHRCLLAMLFDNPDLAEVLSNVLDIDDEAIALYHAMGFEPTSWTDAMIVCEREKLAGVTMKLLRRKWQRNFR